MRRLIAHTRAALELSWSDRVAALRRDVAAAFGPNPAPVHVLKRRPGTTTWLTVHDVVRETADAVHIVFGPGLAAWRAGQFLTVHVPIDGVRLRRAYSLCSIDANRPAIAVKRVDGGKVSSHLVAHATPGMRFEVRGPSGQFVLPPATHRRHVVLIGGGSGITPLIALAEEALANGDRVSLVYGNRSRADVIFFERLTTLAARHPNLVVRHVFELLDAPRITHELATLAPPDAIFSCGPAPMMDAVRATSDALGLRALLHEERFQSLAERRSSALPTTPQPLRIVRAGRTLDVLARPGATILEAGLAANVAMPFSCTMGGCGACRVRVRGDVVHDTPNGLGAEEAAAGYAFACIARPLGPCTVEVPS